MRTFKDWLANVESNVSAETSTSTGDVAGNPFGAGIQHYNPSRDQYGLLKKKKKDGSEEGLGGQVIPMRFTGGKPAGSRE
jgi:hypothetical protein